MTRMIRLLSLTLLVVVGITTVSTSAVNASDTATGPRRASSYINPDTGAATANADVKATSECEQPDRTDRQTVSPTGTTTNNVHNDACLFDRAGNRVSGPATFEATGAGGISACPDPDGAGPEFSVLSDTNGDGQTDRCFQSAYQTKGIDGDLEYHARLNSTTPGRQRVTFCADPEQNGCGDARVRSRITIRWVA
jgi:hypothetical protein